MMTVLCGFNGLGGRFLIQRRSPCWAKETVSPVSRKQAAENVAALLDLESRIGRRRVSWRRTLEPACTVFEPHARRPVPRAAPSGEPRYVCRTGGGTSPALGFARRRS